MPDLLPPILLPALLLATGAGLAQPVATPPAPEISGGIVWRALTPEQTDALRPLAQLWPTLDAQQQRKWIALARNFRRMSPQEQATLQSRMTEWAKLSPAQRTQARWNFGETQHVPADEKRAKWEEYLALPANERQRLADERPKAPGGAAPALKPTPAGRIVRPPRAAPGAPSVIGPGKTAAPREPNTLLPTAPPAPDAAPAR